MREAEELTLRSYREQLRDSPVSAVQIADALSSFRSQFSVAIEEFAILADGRRLVFGRQGFSGRAFGFGGEPDPVDQWALVTVEEVERDVLTTVLPDDDETAAEHDHDWWHIAICLRGMSNRRRRRVSGARRSYDVAERLAGGREIVPGPPESSSSSYVVS